MASCSEQPLHQNLGLADPFCTLLVQILIIAVNPGIEDEEFLGQVEILRAARTELDVAWRTGDAASMQQLPIGELEAGAQ